MNHSGFVRWPIKAQDDKNINTIGNCSEVLKRLPITTFLGFNIVRDNGNLSSYAIQINQLTLRLVGRNQLISPRKNNSKPIIRAYKKLIQSALKIMNANLSQEELDVLADQLIHFEGQVANLTTPPEKRRNVMALYHRTTIDKLEHNFTQMPLEYLISKELSEVNITVTGNETIQHLAMDYYRKLDRFLRCANCAMPEIVGYLYVLRKFSKEAKQEVEEIVKGIAAVFNETIRGSEWMDDGTKAAAELKVHRHAILIFA
ncbi:hypothetical protein MTO96_016479 [Rhipicephalus appendiculatus]